ncbi:MAG: FprA family A-type flavoprotein [Planctomycetota bacterium]|jgi:flavorubredoxin
MTEPLNAVKISGHVYWVGAIDWSVRDFHGYLTSRGTSYNAYLVTGKKNILIDTVKLPFREEMMSRIASVLPPEKIDCIISNHSEMDHSGSLREVIAAVKPEKVFASKMGVKALGRHFYPALDVEAVENGATLALGDMNFTFFETRMLHWPDSMVSFLAEDGVLFSQDAFGMHYASTERFADQIPDDILHYEAAKYYANIILLYSPQVTKTVTKLLDMNLPLKVIAPDHGPIWREDIARLPKQYLEWAAQKPNMKAVIVFDSMWGSTAKMARAIAEGLSSAGASVRSMSLQSSHRSDVATELLEAGAFIAGSPTLNNGIFPTLADCLTYIRGLKPKNLVGAAFGSYGWSGESVKGLAAALDAMGVEQAGENVKVQYIPDDGDLERCRELGVTIAKAMKEKVGAAS